jgi:flavodoxin
MRALVVFESMFGNTQVIANAVADGLPHDHSTGELLRRGNLGSAPGRRAAAGPQMG